MTRSEDHPHGGPFRSRGWLTILRYLAEQADGIGRQMAREGPLASLLDLIASQLDAIEAEINSLYDEWFAETGTVFLPYLGPSLVVGGGETEAQLQVYVDDEPWLKVDSFDRSAPTDPHYVVDDSAGVIRFGDGQMGRRPATGSSVRTTYRYGMGAAGNVGAVATSGSRSAQRRPHVFNPVPAQGGGDDEVQMGETERSALALVEAWAAVGDVLGSWQDRLAEEAQSPGPPAAPATTGP